MSTIISKSYLLVKANQSIFDSFRMMKVVACLGIQTGGGIIGIDRHGTLLVRRISIRAEEC